MRHYFTASATRAVPRLAGRVAKPTGAAVLIPPARPLERDPTRVPRADA